MGSISHQGPTSPMPMFSSRRTRPTLIPLPSPSTAKTLTVQTPCLNVTATSRPGQGRLRRCPGLRRLADEGRRRFRSAHAGHGDCRPGDREPPGLEQWKCTGRYYHGHRWADGGVVQRVCYRSPLLHVEYNDRTAAISDRLVNDDSEGTPEDTPVTIDVAANDSDSDGSLDLVSANMACPACTGSSNGIVGDNGDGTFDYTPKLNYNGVDSFLLTAPVTTVRHTWRVATATVVDHGRPSRLLRRHGERRSDDTVACRPRQPHGQPAR